MKITHYLFLLLAVLSTPPVTAYAQADNILYDDTMLLNGYTEKFSPEPKETLLAMIMDDSLSSYKAAATVRVFREKFGDKVFSNEKKFTEKILLRRLSKTESVFVDIEVMRTLCFMDRYKYFAAMVPDLITTLDHYNKTANQLAFDSLKEIIARGSNRPREAAIVFNTLRKILFLSRKKLQNIDTPTARLKQKLELLSWSIKILGNQELKKLPPEVINFL